MIAAVASDLGIGKDGKLLFHIKEDMAWFRSHTLHNVVVMDVRHWKVFPEEDRFRSRTHIVLSHKKHENTENVIWVTSVEEALAKMEKRPERFMSPGVSRFTVSSFRWHRNCILPKWHKNVMRMRIFPIFYRMVNGKKWKKISATVFHL